LPLFTSAAAVLLLALAMHAGAQDASPVPWWKKILFRSSSSAESTSQAAESKKMPRVRLGAFAGSTGESARMALRTELLASREFFVATDEEASDFILTGRSVGGRVDAKLADGRGKELFARSYAAPGLDENLKALADDVIFSVTGRPGLATSRIVFVSDRTGRKQIYLTDSDGRDVQQITHDANGAVAPSLSPDGSLIAFTTYRDGFPVARVIDIHSGWDREINDTPGGSHGAAFSPDGTRLSLVMSFIGNPEIFVTDLNTNTAACVSDSIGAPGSPAWHPDGKRLAYANDDGRGSVLYIAEVPEKEGEAARLARWRTGWSDCTDPEWSPDGTQIAFSARKGSQWAVIVKSYPNGRARLIQDGGAMHPSWSPNGRLLCYSHHGQLILHDLKTGARRAILSQYGHITEPRWMR
jgi:TolB protein